MDWQEEYKKKLISAEEAAKLVKSGDFVCLTSREPRDICKALAARREELKGVQISTVGPDYDFGWYEPGWEDSFTFKIGYPTPLARRIVNERRCDMDILPLNPIHFAPYEAISGERKLDVFLVEVSSPDDKGYCSFGVALWDKPKMVQLAQLTLAEVNPYLIRTYGSNYVHVSQIDYFVEHTPSGRKPGGRALSGGAERREPPPFTKDIAGYVSEIIKDGDTLQIGVGGVTEHLVRQGMLDGKHDLGYHSEATVPGMIPLIQSGVINGKYKTVNPGKVVVTSVGGGTLEEMQWVNMNPLIWLVEVDYLEDIKVVAAHDNFVVINDILSIDLWGQITAETLGARIIGGAGGQPSFVVGSFLSKGGRAISVLPSTARDGTVSRIVPHFPEGTVVTIPRTLADYVVTEYGVARLKAKSMRQRAEELIAIAHPDFRPELRKAAQKLFYPS